jgi:Flp pilus assembly protein TadG
VRPAAPGARTDRSDRGQASVEFALALPLLVVMALGLVVIGMAIRHEIAVELAAREGARAAAVSADAAAAASAAARRAVTLPIEVSTTDDGATVSVTVTHTDPVDVAIIGWMIGPITHSATATMAVEPP